MDAIIMHELYKRYGWFLSRRKIVAVNHLSMTIPEKTIFGFLGPNGAGKTTTIKMLLGLVDPDTGYSRIFGIDSRDRDVRGRVGFLPESPHFYGHLTARDFLVFSGKLLHLGRMERAQRAEELLERVTLTKAADQKLEGFSRGMLQRGGIAQALLSDPDLIILDEPINGLDPVGRREVKHILMDLRNDGKTIFFSSHILSDVEEMCNDVCILNHGALVVRGSVEGLLQETGCTVWTEGLSTEAAEGFEGICKSVMKREGRHGFVLASIGREEFISKVDAAGGKVREIQSERETMEDFFLRTIKLDDERLAKEQGEKA